MPKLLLFLCLIELGIAIDAEEKYRGEESWGYIKVRADAFMFWWLYRADAAEDYRKCPLVLWIQGGPGAASSGFGNFEEIGPYDIKLKFRNTTWAKKANLLFLDNPVGTGFSYVAAPSVLCTDNACIANDLSMALANFLHMLPEFQVTPLFILGESYGGKMAADFGLKLYRSIQAENVTCNFKGVVFGDSWISPIDIVSSYGRFLYTMALIDTHQLSQMADVIESIEDLFQNKNYYNASIRLSHLHHLIDSYTYNISWYNIMMNKVQENVQYTEELGKINVLPDYESMYQTHVANFNGEELNKFMNTYIRHKLKIIPQNVTWSKSSSKVFRALVGDFMKPVIESVDALLNETNLGVYLYTGQLDLICNILGLRKWMQKLRWPGMEGFYTAPQVVIPLIGKDPITAGFVKSYKQLHLYTILKAGHMVPKDAAVSALQMLSMITQPKNFGSQKFEKN